MTGKDISKQLSYLPDDMIEEAMEMPKRQKTLRFTARVLRAAACLAVIIGLLFGIFGRDSDPKTPKGGLLTISVGAVGNDGTIITNFALDKNVELPDNFRWNPTYNYLPGIPLTFSVSGEEYNLNDIYFDITVTGGSFLRETNQPGLYKQISLHSTLKNSSTVYWHSWYDSADGVIYFEEDCAYADIIIFEKDTIIGYAVVGFRRLYNNDTPTFSFNAILLESVMFSVGETVTEEYVRPQMEAIKNAKYDFPSVRRNLRRTFFTVKDCLLYKASPGGSWQKSLIFD